MGGTNTIIVSLRIKLEIKGVHNVLATTLHATKD